MLNLITKLQEVELKLSRQSGPCTLFAMIEREEAPNRWDLVVSAPWLGPNKQKPLELIVDLLKQALSTDEIAELSRIVLLDPWDALVENITNSIEAEHGDIQVTSAAFNGLNIRLMHVITANRAAEPSTTKPLPA